MVATAPSQRGSLLVNVAKDFSRYPAGRFLSDGEFSGEKFRHDFLEPAMRNNNHLHICLDGARGYGSSFLEEAFGGLVRLGYEPNDVLASIELESSDKSLILEIKDYIVHGRDE